jgi:hypothetical protein
MLNSASMQNDSSEGAFLFIQLALEAVILFLQAYDHLNRAGAVDLLNELLPRLV